jgi:hypothetical protein
MFSCGERGESTPVLDPYSHLPVVGMSCESITFPSGERSESTPVLDPSGDFVLGEVELWRLVPLS